MDNARQNFLNGHLRRTAPFLDNLRDFAILVLLELRTQLVPLSQVVELHPSLLLAINGRQWLLRLLVNDVLNDWGWL